jgi:hypothetical protein
MGVLVALGAAAGLTSAGFASAEQQSPTSVIKLEPAPIDPIYCT